MHIPDRGWLVGVASRDAHHVDAELLEGELQELP
jgi:hypothetical protein